MRIQIAVSLWETQRYLALAYEILCVGFYLPESMQSYRRTLDETCVLQLYNYQQTVRRFLEIAVATLEYDPYHLANPLTSTSNTDWYR